MKKSLLTYVVFAVWVAFTFLPIACRGWPEAHQDAQDMRRLHAAYRKLVVARNVTETATVDEIGAKIDSAMAHLEELTK